MSGNPLSGITLPVQPQKVGGREEGRKAGSQAGWLIFLDLGSLES